MKTEKIEKIVIKAINEELKENKESIKLDKEGKWKNAELNADLGLNSLRVVEIFLTCEKECGICFDDEEIMKTKTVGDLINKIQEKLK
jgi:acyl carrier protein